MSNEPITVIINCFNGRGFVSKVLTTIVNQTYKNWNIIFCDNQSNDSTCDELKNFLKNSDINLRYVVTPKKLSLGAARNFALSKVETSLVCFLDVDDTWDSRFLEKAVCKFSEIKDLTIYYCNYWQINNSEKIVHNNKTSSCVKYFKDILRGYDIPMSGCVFRYSASKYNRQYFNESFSLIEDYDFFLKLSYNNKVYYDSTPLLNYLMHSNSLTNKHMDKWGDELKTEYDELNVFLSEEEKKIFSKDLNWILVRSINARILKEIRQGNKISALKLLSRNIRYSYKLLFTIFGIVGGYGLYIKLLNLIRRNTYRI